MRRHLVLSLVVSLAAIAGAFGMRAYVGPHTVERIVERNTVLRIEEKPHAATVVLPRAPKHRRVVGHRPTVKHRQTSDDSANELNRRQL